jgi:hypothetical protein
LAKYATKTDWLDIPLALLGRAEEVIVKATDFRCWHV